MISRQSWMLNTVAVDTALADAERIDMQESAGGTIFVPTGSSLTSLAFYGSHDGTTFLALYDSSNAAVTRTVAAARAYALPDECFGCRFLKLVGNADGVVNMSIKG